MARDRFPPKLNRSRAPKVEPRFKVTIFCEGRNTEPDYFEALARSFANGLVKVESIGGVGVPLTLVREAVAAKKATLKRRDSFNARDQFWVAFDRDEHPNIPQAQDMARDNGVQVAFSNPCFELWLYLHLKEQDAPLSPYEAQKLLKSCIPGYDPTRAKRCCFEEISHGIADACVRAQRMRERRVAEGAQFDSPYTDVDILVSVILEGGRPPLA